MQIVLSLHTDKYGYGHLIYLLDKIFIKPKLIQTYCHIYKDRLVIYQNKVYLNGEVLIENYNLKKTYPSIDFPSKYYNKIEYLPGFDEIREDKDKNGDKIYTYYISGDVYYICETDGKDFDINKVIKGRYTILE